MTTLGELMDQAEAGALKYAELADIVAEQPAANVMAFISLARLLGRRLDALRDDLGVLDIDDRYDDIPDDSGIHIFRNDLEEYNA